MSGKSTDGKGKAHRAMPDSVWYARLQEFADKGVWPSSAGNRPAPRQAKWYRLYQEVRAFIVL